jgi:hypothetical protein
MSSVSSSVKEVQDIMQSNIEKILQRGEKLQSLAKKVDELKDTSALFKKRARKIKEEQEMPIISPPELNDEDLPLLRSPSSLDYLTKIEDTDMSEYEQQLTEYYHIGQYQYVLDKASQLGLLHFVKQILKLSEYYPIKLNIANALNHASHYGHIEIVNELLTHDIENERYYGKAPREEVIAILPFFHNKSRIPYTNEPLTHDDLRRCIITAYNSYHKELAATLEAYYYKTHAVKDRHDTIKADKFLAKII